MGEAAEASLASLSVDVVLLPGEFMDMVLPSTDVVLLSTDVVPLPLPVDGVVLAVDVAELASLGDLGGSQFW